MTEPASGTKATSPKRLLWVAAIGWAIVVFGAGFFTGRAVGRSTTVGPLPSPTPSPSPTETAAGALDLTGLGGLWQLDLTEAADSCGRYPAAYSERITVTVDPVSRSISLAESVPSGETPSGGRASAVGTVTEDGGFTAATTGTRTGASGAAQAFAINYTGRFAAGTTATGAYRIESGGCAVQYDFTARHLAS